MYKYFLIAAIIFITGGCASTHEKIAQKTSETYLAYGFTTKIYQTKNFKIYTLQRITNINDNVRIYFEGDGKVFIRNGLVSPNPTPTSDFLPKLLTKDNSPNVVYIARPCQFTSDSKCYSGVPEKYWTSSRFSREVTSSIEEVVNNFSEFKIELVGYSGGATIMKYVAAQSQKNFNNVVSLRSIAGNLENREFAKIHKMSASDEDSSNDRRIYETLQNIPQLHFVGSDDKIIPPVISQIYVKKLPSKNCARILTIPGVGHIAGWLEIWADLLNVEAHCNVTKTNDAIGYGLNDITFNKPQPYQAFTAPNPTTRDDTNVYDVEEKDENKWSPKIDDSEKGKQNQKELKKFIEDEMFDSIIIKSKPLDTRIVQDKPIEKTTDDEVSGDEEFESKEVESKEIKPKEVEPTKSEEQEIKTTKPTEPAPEEPIVVETKPNKEVKKTDKVDQNKKSDKKDTTKTKEKSEKKTGDKKKESAADKNSKPSDTEVKKVVEEKKVEEFTSEKVVESAPEVAPDQPVKIKRYKLKVNQ